jgi:hypothetical protein
VSIPYDSQRTAHGLDPIGKAFFKALHRKATPQKPLSFKFGYIKQLLREAAIKMQLIVRQKGECLPTYPIPSHHMTSKRFSISHT